MASDRKKVLIVEDDQFVQRAYRRLFHDHEFQIAGDPIEARHILATGFQPDVIVSDWNMPRMNGGMLCEILRAEGNETPFYIVSGESRIEEAKACGANGSYVKPLAREDIKAILGE